MSETLQLDRRTQGPGTQAALGIHLKRLGRPPGSKAQVILDARALGFHHFAFVRSSLWGLDLAHSFERYLAWSETTTVLRYVQNRRDALLKQIIEAGRYLNSSLPEAAKITDILDLLRSDQAAKPTLKLSTLEEWVESECMDPDVWSEADLIAEHQSTFGLENPDAPAAAEGAKDVVAYPHPSNRQLERHIRQSAANSSNVAFVKHAGSQMRVRQVNQPMVMEVLRIGRMFSQPEPDIRFSGLKCRMEDFVSGMNVADGRLRNVWLVNGYEIKKAPFGEAVGFHDGDGLTQAICQALTEKVGILTGTELRYIRSAGMGLS